MAAIGVTRRGGAGERRGGEGGGAAARGAFVRARPSSSLPVPARPGSAEPCPSPVPPPKGGQGRGRARNGGVEENARPEGRTPCSAKSVRQSSLIVVRSGRSNTPALLAFGGMFLVVAWAMTDEPEQGEPLPLMFWSTFRHHLGF